MQELLEDGHRNPFADDRRHSMRKETPHRTRACQEERRRLPGSHVDRGKRNPSGASINPFGSPGCMLPTRISLARLAPAVVHHARLQANRSLHTFLIHSRLYLSRYPCRILDLLVLADPSRGGWLTGPTARPTSRPSRSSRNPRTPPGWNTRRGSGTPSPPRRSRSLPQNRPASALLRGLVRPPSCMPGIIHGPEGGKHGSGDSTSPAGTTSKKSKIT